MNNVSILNNKEKPKNNFLIYFNVFLILFILISQKIAKTIPSFSIVDEIIIISMFLIVIFKIISLKYKYSFLDFLIILFVAYSLYLIKRNDIPIHNAIQIFIYSKFIILFIYFNSFNSKIKYRIFILLLKLLAIIYIISLILTILQFGFPSFFDVYTRDGRGISGIAAEGIFGSRTTYPEFLILFIILILSMYNYKIKIIKYFSRYKFILILLTFILIFLTSARKELLLLFILVLPLINSKIKNNSKIIFYFIYIFLFIIILVIASYLMADLNNKSFSEGQIRLIIFFHSLDIFNFYFPFGSGPGTFGSIMSLEYTNIYEQFQVGANVTGYGDRRGPIFDLFLFSLLAEYGLGLFLFIALFWNMLSKKQNNYLSKIINIRKYKISLIIAFGSTSFFVPMLLNWIGFLYIIILALLTTNKGFNQ